MDQTQPNPLELAKQGNVKAIAILINRQLKPKATLFIAKLFESVRENARIESAAFPELNLTAEQIFRVGQ